MLHRLLLIAATLLVSGCGDLAELVSQTKTVAAPREQVFAKMFGTDGSDFDDIPLVTNGGSTRLYELTVQKGEPGFDKLVPKERPDAGKVKLMVAMEIPRETHILYDVDDGALRTGLKFTFEELSPATTRVAFTVDELTGRDTKGLVVNAAKLHALAREALDKLDDFEEADTAA